MPLLQLAKPTLQVPLHQHQLPQDQVLLHLINRPMVRTTPTGHQNQSTMMLSRPASHSSTTSTRSLNIRMATSTQLTVLMAHTVTGICTVSHSVTPNGQCQPTLPQSRSTLTLRTQLIFKLFNLRNENEKLK